MNKEELLKFLQENLEIEVESNYGYGDTRQQVKVSLSLNNETISEDWVYINID